LPWKVFAGHYVSGSLRPVSRDLNVALLKDDRAFVIPDRSRPQVPMNVVIGSFAGFHPAGEISGE